LIFLTDDMHRLVLGQPLNPTGSSGGMAGSPASAKSREDVAHIAATRGCFDAFSRPENLVQVAQELRDGPVACLRAGSEHYDERSGVDTRIQCLSDWALGSVDETMDSCLVHNDCLAPGIDGGSLSFSSVQACAASACSHLVPTAMNQRAALAVCIDACPINTAAEPDFLCAAQCLALHTPFSQMGTAILQCSSAPREDLAQGQMEPEGDVTFDRLLHWISCVAGSAKFQPPSKIWELVADSARCLGN